ncbi:MAG TPA: RNA polymerase sigma factor, partial [Vineibacter sp.]|nr:RNA polymerase sigma factor [Vineibacter sp.]
FRQRLLAIFTEHRAALTRFLERRLGSASLAEDLTQETWVRAATASTNGVPANDNPRGYLFRIAANLVIDHRRHTRRGIEVDAPAPLRDAIADPTPSPEVIALHRSEMARLLRAVDRLPPRCRQVFLLTKVHELSYAEVAARLGISRNTVMVHMTNALAALDAHLDAQSTADD